nr:MAG TPA: hypothetical protein [Bacteriophage sp.]
MKIVKIEEMTIDLVESDHEHPWQCEFDIAGLNANYFIITMDSEFGYAYTQLFDPKYIGSPGVFLQSGNIPTDVKLYADATGIRIECSDRSFKHATMTAFDSNDGRNENELQEVIVDVSKVNQIALLVDDAIQMATGTPSVKGPEVTLAVSAPINGESIRAYYMDVDGVRYYCDLNLVGKITDSEITLDRFQKLYKYYM